MTNVENFLIIFQRIKWERSAKPPFSFFILIFVHIYLFALIHPTSLMTLNFGLVELVNLNHFFSLFFEKMPFFIAKWQKYFAMLVYFLPLYIWQKSERSKILGINSGKKFLQGLFVRNFCNKFWENTNMFFWHTMW